jgi:hypothetical protein
MTAPRMVVSSPSLSVFPCDRTSEPHIDGAKETELLGVLAVPPSEGWPLVAFER